MPHRFFIPPNWITPPTVTLHGEAARQIRTVLRMQPGDEVVVLDNSGAEWRVRLTNVAKDTVQGQIVNQQPARGEPSVQLTLYQGTLKGQKFEWVLQKGTELGVSCFVPTICERSVVRRPQALEKKRNRWETIVSEASEQSGRGKLPRLEQAMSLSNALAHAQSAGLMLMPWEEADGESLREILRNTDFTNVALFIGPEGGYSSDEATMGQQMGAKLVKLGPRIMRAETAGLAATVAILYELEDWR